METTNARDILETILKKLSIDVRRIEVVAGDPHPLLSVSTPDSALLIGREGDHLRALNYLLKRIMEEKYKNSPAHANFLVDINGYHRKHITALKQQAKILAERARTYRSDVAMPHLNAYDRMIVHAAYANDPDVYTESAGFGKDRHVVFKYKKAESNPISSDRELFAEETR